MKFFVAVVALVAVASAVLVESAGLFGKFKIKGSIFGKNLDNEPGHHIELREQLGHFKEGLLRNLYKYYAASFVHPRHPERANDHYGNYLATGDECMKYLRNFRVANYEVLDIHEFVLLDSCLGYIFDSKYRDTDREKSHAVKEYLAGFESDETLRQIYTQTKFSEISKEGKLCAGTLLMDWILARKQFPGVICDNHMIAILNNFGDCHKAIPQDQRDSDSYLKILYGLVHKYGQTCFRQEIIHTNEAARHIYSKSYFSDRLKNKLTQKFNKLRNQAGDYMWTSKLFKLLALVQGTDHEVNSREIANILTGIQQKDEDFVNRFLDNLAHYADRVVEPTKNKKSVAHSEDVYGLDRYERAMDDLCNFFRVSDDSTQYDFVTPFEELIRMLQHPDLFGMEVDYFLQHALVDSYESGAIYLAVTSCQLITYTEARLSGPDSGNAPLNYEVKFKSNLSEMIRWPQLDRY